VWLPAGLVNHSGFQPHPVNAVVLPQRKQMPRQFVECNRCDFTLDLDSDTRGNHLCICGSCRALFACPTESEWGPEIGEKIELQRIVHAGHGTCVEIDFLPTGTFIFVEKGKQERIGNLDVAECHFPTETVACPDCGQKDLASRLDIGERCPRCADGTMIGRTADR
jgi:hypothetical protein